NPDTALPTDREGLIGSQGVRGISSPDSIDNPVHNSRPRAATRGRQWVFTRPSVTVRVVHLDFVEGGTRRIVTADDVEFAVRNRSSAMPSGRRQVGLSAPRVRSRIIAIHFMGQNSAGVH